MPVSVSHSVFPALDVAPLFLTVKAGMTVCVREIGADFAAVKQEADWWMGDVLFAEGGARDPKAPSLFQIADYFGQFSNAYNQPEPRKSNTF